MNMQVHILRSSSSSSNSSSDSSSESESEADEDEDEAKAEASEEVKMAPEKTPSPVYKTSSIGTPNSVDVSSHNSGR